MELDSTYWRERAAEMRKIAGQTKDPQSKGTMLEIATQANSWIHQQFMMGSLCKLLKEVAEDVQEEQRTLHQPWCTGGNQ